MRSTSGAAVRSVGAAVGIAALCLLGPVVGIARADVVFSAAVNYPLDRSGFNITDHNLTYATNMVTVNPTAAASFSLVYWNNLSAAPAVPRADAESELGVGPGPNGPEEYNITPLLIIQEAASGLLRIEYVPFPMNDTFGFLVYEGFIATSGAAPFAGHALTITYVETAPAIKPYPISVPYGSTTGNLTVLWDGAAIVPHYPIAWASLGAFYNYGLHTGTFDSGSASASVASGSVAPNGPTGTSTSSLSASVPLWLVAGLVGAVIAGALGVAIGRRRRPPEAH